MATQTRCSQRKNRWTVPTPGRLPSPPAQPYRRRRPETTSLHRIVRENLESYLTQVAEADPMGEAFNYAEEFKTLDLAAVK